MIVPRRRPARKLKPRRPAADIMDFCGILSDEDAAEMIRVIDEEFENIDEE